MPRPPLTPRRDEPAGPSAVVPSWAGDMAEAPLPPTDVGPSSPQQMGLFPAAELAPSTARRERLAGPIKALLTAIEGPKTRSRRVKAPAPNPDSATSSWPDSFFDVPPAS